MCIRKVQNTIKYNYIIIVQVSQFDGFTTVMNDRNCEKEHLIIHMYNNVTCSKKNKVQGLNYLVT